MNDRQDRLVGFDTAKLRAASILVIGAGGLGGHIGASLVRKGVGRLIFADHDVVELSNLSRQVFVAEDVHQPKAIRLAKNLSRQGFMGTECVGQAVGFYDETADYLADGVDAAILAVDNNATRILGSQYFGDRGIPAVFTAVNEDATFTWVFVQTSRRPCVACVFPAMADALVKPEPCRDVASSIDILKASAALVSYAVDSLLMSRRRLWDYYDIDLTGSARNVVDRPKPRPCCPICSGSNGET